MKYNFDEIIERKRTNAMSVEGFREYIFQDVEHKLELPYPDDEFVRMWVADMDFATPDVVVDAIKERVEKRIFGYTRVFDPGYYEAFVNWTKRRYDWTFNKKDLVMSNGIIPALFELVEYICKDEENVLFLTPSYAYFKYAADFNGRKSVCSDLINTDGYFTMDYDDLEDKMANENIGVVIFCHPHNPTGRVWKEDELKKFGDICVKHNKYVISDEIHCDLLRQGETHIPMAKLFPEYERLITCMAPSKTFNLAGMMISNIIIPDAEIRGRWNARHYNFDNPLSIAATQGAYEKGEEWLEELRAYLDGNMQYVGECLKENLPAANFRIPEATYLAWVDATAYFTAEDDIPMFFAKKAGVLLEGSTMFVQNGNGFFRLNVACPRSVLEDGMDRVCKALNEKGTVAHK